MATTPLPNALPLLTMKKNIAIVAGGYTDEIAISLKSAAVVFSHFDTKKFNTYDVRITRRKWVVVVDGREYPIDKNDFSSLVDGAKVSFDGVFMAIHGTPGEDGKLQGYFDMLEIPYNNCNVVTSALTFNKSMCNNFLKSYGVQSANSILLLAGVPYSTMDILQQISIPCFVKPNGAGSSLGISKVNDAKDLGPAIEKAFVQDDEVLIEDFIEGVELSCGAIKLNGVVSAQAVTEIVATNEFFDYDAKYHNLGTQEITPARISDEHYDACLLLTEAIYDYLNCKGMIRVDYILKEGTLFVIEVNTTPGLSEQSIYPKQAVYAKISLKDLFTGSMEEAFR